eukprot:2829222-Prymnesium_polylepis.1
MRSATGCTGTPRPKTKRWKRIRPQRPLVIEPSGKASSGRRLESRCARTARLTSVSWSEFSSSRCARGVGT